MGNNINKNKGVGLLPGIADTIRHALYLSLMTMILLNQKGRKNAAFQTDFKSIEIVGKNAPAKSY